jgi:epoxyqueuosine reductase
VDFEKVRVEYALHADRYRLWVEAKNHADMGYLERGLARRLDPTLVFPELKSVITVLKPYPPHPVGTESLRYARYLNGPDYHETLKSGLEVAINNLKATGKVPADFKYKICVDTSAVLERTWASLCGLGWIGKNTLLIHPQLGSYVFIGVVFTSLEFGMKPEPMKDYCGNCTRCLRACPTEALKSHVLDSRKCISYLTIEKRGEWSEALPTRGFVAGCDLCQEVCPYNTKPVKYATDSGTAPYLITDRNLLLQETEEVYQSRIQGTALERIRYSDFKRNLKATLPENRK